MLCLLQRVKRALRLVPAVVAAAGVEGGRRWQVLLLKPVPRLPHAGSYTVECRTLDMHGAAARAAEPQPPAREGSRHDTRPEQHQRPRYHESHPRHSYVPPPSYNHGPPAAKKPTHYYDAGGSRRRYRTADTAEQHARRVASDRRRVTKRRETHMRESRSSDATQTPADDAGEAGC